ncbi:MAG: arginine--tRNA ligase [Beijerinckiaceae bacterium]|nr:arginine--tRNA ligase [Beijerinckiaceae bacterium]MCZ8299841.1 arginine--tRNA ligase [Beijerinckiaceae bacterium]
MNIFHAFSADLQAVLADLPATAALSPEIRGRATVEPPRDPAHGDLSTNAAMVLAKEAGSNPRALAEGIAAKLRESGRYPRVEVAGPGFINVGLAPVAFEDVLRAAIAAGPDFGRSPLGQGRAVNVEYVSANPTGPMHVGHGRGAVYGDALANLLDFAGWKVSREYYINDAGAQVDVLARSAFHRYREALGRDVGPVGEGLYPGDYLIPAGKALAEAHGAALESMPEAEWLPIVRKAAIDAMMAMIRDDLAAIDIRHDVFFSEASLQAPVDQVAATIADFRARDLIYEGRLPPPKGQKDEDWEDREQTLFRATAFGDDVDRPLLKSDGGYTYFASDIAYHANKFARGFAEMIDVWGADHGGYVKRMQAAVKAATAGKGALEVRLCQLVKLMRNGEPVKMSKRAGDFVTLRDVIDEVGRDAIRFMMLDRKNDAELEFDLAKVIEQSKDNPVFYVQYAHARCASVLDRQARTAFDSNPISVSEIHGADLSVLRDEGERALMRMIAQYPRLIEQAASTREPHRVVFYLYDLASAFHGLWNRGKDLPDLRFINNDDRKGTMARLALVTAVRIVIANGLRLLGVSAPDEMR